MSIFFNGNYKHITWLSLERMDKGACNAEITGMKMETGLGEWFNSESQALQENYKGLEAGMGRQVTECSIQSNPKSKSTSAARAARHSEAN